EPDGRPNGKIGEEGQRAERGDPDGAGAPAPERPGHVAEGVVLEAVLGGRSGIVRAARGPSQHQRLTSRGRSSRCGVSFALPPGDEPARQILSASRTSACAAAPPAPEVAM